MATSSGTVSLYTYTNERIIEHAARRAGLRPQDLGAEDLRVCLDLLFTLTAEWTNVGFPLWTREFQLLSCAIGSPDVVTPVGTVEVLHSYWRILNPYRGACTVSGNVGNTSLFSGQPSTDVSITAVNPGVTVNFTDQTEIDTIGVILGGTAPLTTALELWGSSDGVLFEQLEVLPSTTYQPGQWAYFDLDPTLSIQYLQILYNTAGQSATWTLNQLQFALANGQDIENGPLNIDDYYNLPNKQFRSDRPNSVYQDRQVAGPVLKIWPTLNTEGFYNGTVSALMRRYIQDPGTLTDIMEMPQRWFEAVTWRLASRVIHEVPDPRMRDADAQTKQLLMQDRQQRIAVCDREAGRSETLAWSEERVKAPIRLYPIMSCYTK